MPDVLTSYYFSGDAIRSRSVSATVLTATLDIPAPGAHVIADWQREASTRLMLEAGDVEPLPLARAQRRWPDYRLCVRAIEAWAHAEGLQDVLASSDMALMACRGARYHHDGGQYGGAAFCNLFLSEDKGLDVHFPLSGHRIPLKRGTAIVFDTCQPHAVVPRGGVRFDPQDFPDGHDLMQWFLTWELPIETPAVAHRLGIVFDVAPDAARGLEDEAVWVNGAPAELDPEWGRFIGSASEAAPP